MSLQIDLFDDFSGKVPNQQFELGKIQDLEYVSNFLSKEEHDYLWDKINDSQWLSDLKRRVQHYGWKYDYKSRSINYSMFLGALPDWALNIATRLFELGYINELPDQLIVNEYLPGQGIANHVDCEPCFTDTIISLSLGSICVMDFINLITKEKIEILLEPRSLVVVKGDSRYKWTHGIPARKTDTIKGLKFDRKKRISLTFRKVITSEKDNNY